MRIYNRPSSTPMAARTDPLDKPATPAYTPRMTHSELLRKLHAAWAMLAYIYHGDDDAVRAAGANDPNIQSLVARLEARRASMRKYQAKQRASGAQRSSRSKCQHCGIYPPNHTPSCPNLNL